MDSFRSLACVLSTAFHSSNFYFHNMAAVPLLLLWPFFSFKLSSIRIASFLLYSFLQFICDSWKINFVGMLKINKLDFRYFVGSLEIYRRFFPPFKLFFFVYCFRSVRAWSFICWGYCLKWHLGHATHVDTKHIQTIVESFQRTKPHAVFGAKYNMKRTWHSKWKLSCTHCSQMPHN